MRADSGTCVRALVSEHCVSGLGFEKTRRQVGVDRTSGCVTRRVCDKTSGSVTSQVAMAVACALLKLLEADNCPRRRDFIGVGREGDVRR